MNTLSARNPRTGKWDYETTATATHQLPGLCQALRQAQLQWAGQPLDVRIAVLQRWRDSLKQEANAIAEALSIDTGRQLLSHYEVHGMIERIDYWCERAPALLDTPKGQSACMASVSYQQQRQPYGLVAIISPWNFPMTLGLIDAIPALLAGCAVCLKPSEITPRFTAPLTRSIARVPELATVFQLVLGGAQLGQALIDQCDMVCFTGSVATGKKVAAQAAGRLIPACLELGGKDPALVLAGADLDNACRAIVRSAIGSSGQACMSLEVVYVEAAVAGALQEKLVHACQQLKPNYPDSHAGHYGPIIFEAQAHKIAAQINDAVDKGARIECGGKVEQLGGGYWCQPTVLTHVNEQMLVLQEETFGPLIPIIPVANADEGLEKINAGPFGLSAAVFAADAETALTVAQKLNAGAVNINDASLTAMVHDVEKNSFGCSGLGPSRMGPAGLLRFTRSKALLIQTQPALDLAVFAER